MQKIIFPINNLNIKTPLNSKSGEFYYHFRDENCETLEGLEC